jgi:hypothetical protein
MSRAGRPQRVAARHHTRCIRLPAPPRAAKTTPAQRILSYPAGTIHAMRTDDFWAVIDRATADRPASPDEVAKRAAADLATHDPEEIIAWGRHLDKVLAASGKEDLWAAAYLINGGCSDDGFDNFRGWLIAHGRDVVARAVREPDSLADLPAAPAPAVVAVPGAARLRARRRAGRSVRRSDRVEVPLPPQLPRTRCDSSARHRRGTIGGPARRRRHPDL